MAEQDQHGQASDGVQALWILSSLSLSVPFPFHLQEPRCCLWAIPRVPSTFQGIAKRRVTWLLPGISIFLCPGTAARFSEVTSHCWTPLLGRLAIFVPLVARRCRWDRKGRLFANWWLSVPPFYSIKAKDGFWYVLGASLRLTPWLHSQKLENFDPARGLAPVQTGPLPLKKWPLNGTLAFPKSKEKTQNFLTFTPLWPSVRIQIWGLMCLFVASQSPIALCFSPSDFLDNPCSTFHIHMISKKGF